MLYTKPELVALACDTAIEEGLDPVLVCAAIDVLSAWHPSTKTWYPSEHPEGSFKYGLLQIPASLVKEKEGLEDLLEAPANLKLGCKLLKNCLEKANSDLFKTFLLWDASQRDLSLLVERKLHLYRAFLAQRPRPVEICECS